MSMETEQSVESDVVQLDRLRLVHSRLTDEIARVIVGQEDVVHQLLIALFAGGHSLLMGVPGLAKTMLVRTLAAALGMSFRRIQFTPDLMPADITGTDVIQDDPVHGSRSLRFLPGPVFANVVLADEINRTPPRTQAALLEAMQEYQVTAGGVRHPLPDPFFVLATQNPIEQEGTYPLPEAQLDRFMFLIHMDYPDERDESEIVRRTTGDESVTTDPVLCAGDVSDMQHLVRRIPVADHVIEFATRYSRISRPTEPQAPDFVRDYVSWGAGPRASQYLILAAKARAALRGAPFAGVQDVLAVAAPVLRHRIITNFRADTDRVTPDQIIEKLTELLHCQRQEFEQR